MIEKLKADIKTAMREKDKVALMTLRGVKSEADSIAKKQTRDTTSADVETSILKGIKQRNESITIYVAGGHEDRADIERSEVAILQAFLPEQLDENAIVVIIDEVLASTGATTKKEMGKVMGALSGKIAKGSADMKLVSSIVGRKLL